GPQSTGAKDQTRSPLARNPNCGESAPGPGTLSRRRSWTDDPGEIVHRGRRNSSLHLPHPANGKHAAAHRGKWVGRPVDVLNAKTGNKRAERSGARTEKGVTTRHPKPADPPARS